MSLHVEWMDGWSSLHTGRNGGVSNDTECPASQKPAETSVNSRALRRRKGPGALLGFGRGKSGTNIVSIFLRAGTPNRKQERSRMTGSAPATQIKLRSNLIGRNSSQLHEVKLQAA
jgi:hypothetical protein